MRDILEEQLRARDLDAVEQVVLELSTEELASLLMSLPASERGVLFRLLERDRAVDAFEALPEGPVRRDLLGELEASDREDFLSRLSDEELAALERAIGPEALADLISDVTPWAAARVVERLDTPSAGGVLAAMRPDDATDVIGRLEPADADRVLEALEASTAAALRGLLAYPPDTAAGRMTPEFATIPPDLRADEAISEIRALAERAETLNYIYVADRDGRLAGVVSMRDLVMSRPDRAVEDLMVRDVVHVRADHDQEEAARLLTQYQLLALPVVDDSNRLLGIITEDDIADVIEAEATEDIHRLGGVQPLDTSYRQASIPGLYRRRVGWLLALVFVNIGSSGVIETFEATLEATIALAFFIPLLIDSGGNAGSQAATLVVRALGTGDVRPAEWPRVLWKELRIGLALGMSMAFAAALLGYWRADMDLAIVVFATMVAIIVLANLVGAMLPAVLSRARIDPAVASSPLITTVMDISGLLIYFSIAATFLSVD